MKLSLRMETVKNTVIPCNTACDIGCDHGFVSIALVQEGIAKRVIACDINKVLCRPLRIILRRRGCRMLLRPDYQMVYIKLQPETRPIP